MFLQKDFFPGKGGVPKKKHIKHLFIFVFVVFTSQTNILRGGGGEVQSLPWMWH